MAKQRLTQKHFDIFRNECERVAGLLNLRDWAFLYEFEKLDFGVRAEVTWNIGDRTAIITLARSWEKIGLQGLLADKVHETARHEVLHVFLAGIQDRNCDSVEIDGRVHAIVNSLQGLLTERKEK